MWNESYAREKEWKKVFHGIQGSERRMKTIHQFPKKKKQKIEVTEKNKRFLYLLVGLKMFDSFVSVAPVLQKSTIGKSCCCYSLMSRTLICQMFEYFLKGTQNNIIIIIRKSFGQ